MPRVHTVVPGDTLSAIALRFYGDAMKFGIIAQANGIRNPDVIFAGQVLNIPDLPPSPPAAQPEPQPQPVPSPPEGPPQPIDFRLLRPADLLNRVTSPADADYRQVMADRFAVWGEVTALDAAA